MILTPHISDGDDESGVKGGKKAKGKKAPTEPKQDDIDKPETPKEAPPSEPAPTAAPTAVPLDAVAP